MDKIEESIQERMAKCAQSMLKTEMKQTKNLLKLDLMLNPPFLYDVLPLTKKFNFGYPVEQFKLKYGTMQT